MTRTFCTLLFCLSAISVFAQFGGGYTYSFLNLPPSARIAALGGLNISSYDDDINFAYQNPALINAGMDGKFAANHSIMKGNINHGTIAYGRYIPKWKTTMDFGVNYNAYGLFEETDETGVTTGSYKAGDFALYSGASYTASKLTYGANLKLIYSQLESYSSLGAAVDLGAMFNDTAKRFTAALTMRNIGTEFKSYTSGNHEELPFQVSLGISKRLAHLPLRFSITAHDLQTFDIRYDDPNAVQEVNIFNQDSTRDESNFTGDKILRHFIVGGEFYFGKSFQARVGYDHMMRRELSLDTKRGLTGFSLGFGIKIKKYQIDYTHQFIALAGGSNYLTIEMNLHEIGKH